MTKASARTEEVVQRAPEDETRAESIADLGFVPRTELGRLAIAARHEYISSGKRFLSRDEIEHEVAERRGVTHLLIDR